MKPEELLVERFTKLGKSVCFAESCTGGLITKRITDVPGASRVLKGGVCSYANEVKHNLLGVPQEILDTKGAVSAECALYMAKGAGKLLNTDVCVSVTGIAGPGSDGPKPAGLVYIALSVNGTCIVRKCNFKGSRDEVRTQSADYALSLALKAAD